MTLNSRARGLAFAATIALAPLPSFADELAPAVTQHQIAINGKTLKYTAEIGRVAIRDAETGEPHGYMGYTAYRVATSGKPRPMLFVWNGGPGADSSTLHFGIVGPLRAENGRLVDNADTWLTAADVVMVDPIGTGFSRPTKAEYDKEFYGTVGDVNSVTEFVRSWRLLHGAEDSPLFLAGESWGSGRAGSVGYALEKRGITVNGLVMISGGTGVRSEGESRALSAVLDVPDRAMTALYHGKTDPALGKDPAAVRKAAEAWAREVYAPALEKADTLSDADRAKIVAQLSGFVGLKPEQINAKTLSYTPRQYLEGLLKDEGKRLNVFDMRQTGGDEPAAPRAVVMHYFRHDLGYHTDLPYIGVERLDQGFAPNGKYPEGVGNRWNYATIDVTPEELAKAKAAASERGGGPPRLGPPLPSAEEAIGINPNMKVLVAAGQYDSLNSCTRNAETWRHLSAALQKAVTMKCYTGGHMMYHDAATRPALSKDVRALVETAQ